jgi:hypothetical protein
MTSSILLSSKNMAWQTPNWFLDIVRLVGDIWFDPCTTDKNPVAANVFCTTTNSGLSIDWKELYVRYLADHSITTNNLLGFANPPYGRFLSGPIRPYKQVKDRSGAILGIGTGWAEKIATSPCPMLSLVPTRTETAWWRRLFYSSDAVCLWSSPYFGSRIQFLDPVTGKPKTGSTIASTVFYSGPNVDTFKSVFGAHGTLIRSA